MTSSKFSAPEYTGTLTLFDDHSSILKLLKIYNFCDLAFDEWCVTTETFKLIDNAEDNLRNQSVDSNLLLSTDTSQLGYIVSCAFIFS